MRTVVKGVESKELRDWKRSNATSPQNRHYDNLSRPVRAAMLKKLAAEQGGLCAYTMKQITDKDGGLQAHIEHILPRSAALLHKYLKKFITNQKLAIVNQ